jgi:hypothetical protein
MPNGLWNKADHYRQLVDVDDGWIARSAAAAAPPALAKRSFLALGATDIRRSLVLLAAFVTDWNTVGFPELKRWKQYALVEWTRLWPSLCRCLSGIAGTKG